MNTNIVRFLAAILPDLVELGSDMFELFRGNVGAARVEIADRRANIAARRRANDAALEEKYRKE